MMRWSKGGRHEGLNMLGLAIRVRIATLTCPTRSAFGEDALARAAPAHPEALLAVQAVQVARIEEHLRRIGHYTFSEGIWMM